MTKFTDQHTVEVDNLAAVNDRKQYAFDASLLASETAGPFWDILRELQISLAVSREYEHFVVVLGTQEGGPAQSVLPLPHPSGMFYDRHSGDLILSSTRTPNLIFWLRQMAAADLRREIVPQTLQRPAGTLFLPYRSAILPGTLYIHEIAQVGGTLVATATGHNFVAALSPQGGWERVWWPRALDGLGIEGFRQNHFQLNGLAAGETLEDCFFSAFSDSIDGAKPWKQGYGPRGKGVIFSGRTREPVCRGLTCPHSVRRRDGMLWLCNSGYGELSTVPCSGDAPPQAVARVPGFTRGLAFSGRYAFVGLSRVIETYEPYAPGLTPSESRCGIAVVDMTDGSVAASLTWPEGYQVFDIQILPGLPSVQLPFELSSQGEINSYLRYLG